MICSACGTDQDEVDSGYCVNPSCGVRLDQPAGPEPADEPEPPGKSGPAGPEGSPVAGAEPDSRPGSDRDVSGEPPESGRTRPTDPRRTEPASTSGSGPAHRPGSDDPSPGPDRAEVATQHRPADADEETEQRTTPAGAVESGWGAGPAWGGHSGQLEPGRGGPPDHPVPSHPLDRIDRIDRRQPGDEPTQPTGVGPADQGEPPASPEATPAPPPDREDSATGTATAVAAASLPHVPRASGAHRAEAPPRAPRRHTTAVVVAGALVLALAAVVAGWQVVSRPTVEQRAEPDTVIEPVADGDTSPSSAEPTPTVEASASPTATAPPVAGDSPGPQRTTAARTAPRPANVVRFALDGARKREAKCPQGVTWSSDRTHGPSAVFDHGGRHCLTSGPVVDTAGDFTVSAWIKLGVRPSDLSMTAVSQDGQTQSGFYLQYSGFHRAWAFNRMSADVMNPNGNATATSSAPVTLEWTHLTGTYHAGSKTLQVYVNGVAGTAVQQHSAWRATGSLVIGRAMWNGERGNFVHGQVADVRVWNRTLSAQEVSRLPGSASAAG